MNRTRALLIVVGALLTFGSMMVLSASAATSIQTTGSPYGIFLRQVLWILAGLVAAVVAYRVPAGRWRRWGPAILVTSMVLLLVVLLPSVGITVEGSRRWLGSGSIRFQPSELAQLGLIIFGSDLMARRSDSPGVPARGLILVSLLLIGLVIVEPDMGTSLVIGAVAAGLLVCGGVKAKKLLAWGGAATVGALVLAVIDPYRRERLLSYLHPWANRHQSAYQLVESLVGLSSGHILGMGLGTSPATWGFLPNAYTDFIFSVIGQETGLIGAVLVLALFVGFVALGIRTAAVAADRFNSLMAAGITCWVGSQAILNVGAVIGVLPVTGVPLPFVSYGGSSLVMMLVAVGLLARISTRAALVGAPKGPGGGAATDGYGSGPEKVASTPQKVASTPGVAAPPGEAGSLLARRVTNSRRRTVARSASGRTVARSASGSNWTGGQ